MLVDLRTFQQRTLDCRGIITRISWSVTPFHSFCRCPLVLDIIHCILTSWFSKMARTTKHVLWIYFFSSSLYQLINRPFVLMDINPDMPKYIPFEYAINSWSFQLQNKKQQMSDSLIHSMGTHRGQGNLLIRMWCNSWIRWWVMRSFDGILGLMEDRLMKNR